MKRLSAAVIVATLTAMLFSAGGFARAQQTTGVPDIEGAWVRLDTVGAGSFGAVNSLTGNAVLTPEAAAAAAGRQGGGGLRPGLVPEDNRPHAAGEPYVVTNGNCMLPGGLEPNSSAFHIIQSKQEVVIVRENPGLHRTIYMDGRKHPELSRWTPTAVGHSVGRYENGALVIDTIGLTPGGVTGGGRRTAETHLTERYTVSADGKRLTMTYTWDDSKIYQKPHTYQIVAERTPPGSWPFEDWCDSGDPTQRTSVIPPKQLP
jgi:hypothetical protein